METRLLETCAFLHVLSIQSVRAGCPYSYQGSIMFLAVTQTQRRVSWELLSSMSQKDVVSRYIFHEIPVRKSHKRLNCKLDKCCTGHLIQIFLSRRSICTLFFMKLHLHASYLFCLFGLCSQIFPIKQQKNLVSN